MQHDKAAVLRELDQTIRAERGWLIASLVSHLGAARVDLAEDVAQDAILKALSSWPYRGIPKSPRAWLRRVAGNIAIDRLRRNARTTDLTDTQLQTSNPEVVTPTLGDAELDLIVLCCDPRLSETEQLSLALTLACGFTAAQLAPLFMVTENTLAQRLARGKRKLRLQSGQVARFPTRFALRARLPQLLRILYLMHCLGYFQRSGDALLDQALSIEALRLCTHLETKIGPMAGLTSALQALILLQMARFPARIDSAGGLVVLDKQDRKLWDQSLIRAGMQALMDAQKSSELTRYHIEAAIAAQHSLSPHWGDTDWDQISRLYDLLYQCAPSQIVEINWAVAQMMQGDLAAAQNTLERATKHNNTLSSPYLLTKAHLQIQLESEAKADTVALLEAALETPHCAPVKAHIQATLASLEPAPPKS